MTVKPTPSQPRGNSLQNEAFCWHTPHHSIACGTSHGRCLEVMICLAQMLYLPHVVFNIFLRKANPWWGSPWQMQQHPRRQSTCKWVVGVLRRWEHTQVVHSSSWCCKMCKMLISAETSASATCHPYLDEPQMSLTSLGWKRGRDYSVLVSCALSWGMVWCREVWRG